MNTQPEAVRIALEQALAAKPGEVEPRRPTPINISLMIDNGGEWPAYCLMAAYRSEDDARAAHAMLTAPPARVDGWQPIETAPKDGCMFLGYAPPPDGVPQVIHAKTYWQSVADGAPRYMPVDECKALTHWMPLPPAPQPTKD